MDIKIQITLSVIKPVVLQQTTSYYHIFYQQNNIATSCLYSNLPVQMHKYCL